MLAAVLTPQQLVCQVGEHVKRESGSRVPRATCLITRAGGVTLDSGIRFPYEFFVTASAFTPGLVLNFWSHRLL